MPHMPIADGSLYYEVHGDGPPLMLVSGLGGVGSFWTPQIAAWATKFKIIIHDHRGTGRSSKDRIAYSVTQMAGDVLALADGLGLERFHFAGHSTGGAIGQVLAIDHGARLLSLVLSGSWMRPDPWFVRCFETRKRLLETGGPAAYVRGQALFLYPPWWVSGNDAAITAMEAAQIATCPPPEIVASRIDAIVAHDPGSALARIATPCLVTCANDDHLTPPHLSQALQAAVPGSRIAILPTGGHYNTVICAAAFNETVDGWLQATITGATWQRPPFLATDTVFRAP